LNEADKALIAMLKTEHQKLKSDGFKVMIPPLFKIETAKLKQLNLPSVQAPKEYEHLSLYFMQTGYFGETARTVCRLIHIQSLSNQPGSINEKQSSKIAIKLSGCGYMYAHRLGAYH